MDTELPILKPIIALLRSRKAFVALITALLNILVLSVPAAEPYREDLFTIITIIGTVLIATIAAEDISVNAAIATENAATIASVEVTTEIGLSQATVEDLRAELAKRKGNP